jgi:N-acetylglutamate synthase-like GNAT family acetyltransferase
VFITRASRHDRSDVGDFLRAQGLGDGGLGAGTVFFAREGGVVGCVRLVEVAPQTLVVDDMVVDGARRRRGIGTSLMQAAMNSRGGTLYAPAGRSCASFFERLGFEEAAPEAVPAPVREHVEASGAPPGHVVMRAR